MDIIEKIEIKHFRSFDGGKDQEKIKIYDLTDLNVFSGANDSGKSNILRCLNLFFNDEISPGVKFDKDRDFSKIVANRFDQEISRRKREQTAEIKKIAEDGGVLTTPKDFRRSDIVISIKLFFNNYLEQRGLPKKFWVSKSYSQKNNFEGDYIYQTNLKGNAQVTLFLKNFQFEYVPAIKDKLFFNFLFEKLQTYLFEKEDKKRENKFSQSSKNFNDALESETKDLFEKFQKSSGVDASFHIPKTLVDFFRTLSVQTENDISLFDRGDGVQARFIPEILDEISKESKKNIIWGFEEPENSYEPKNIRKIRDEFLHKYSRSKQIFVTTHTKEFLSLSKVYTPQEQSILENAKYSSKAKKDAALKRLPMKHRSSNVSIYRVWKNAETNNSSFVTKFDESKKVWTTTCDDLGVIQEARVLEDLQERLSLQAKQIEASQLTVDQQNAIRAEQDRNLKDALEKVEGAGRLIEEYQKPILMVEDSYDAIYKIAYLKLNNIPCTLDDYESQFKENCPFMIRRCGGAGAVAGTLKMNHTDGYDEKRIIGLFDFDKEGSENFYHLKKGSDWDSLIQGETSTGIYKKRNNHPCFYGLLLPVPARHEGLVSDIKNGGFVSFVEIENLLRDEVLTAHQLTKDESILGQNYKKIKNSCKSKMPKILVGLEKNEFADFDPLFNVVAKLFELQ